MFEQYKITAYVKGDTAWIVGDWQGGRRPRHSSAEFSVMVPREMALVKLETDGGNVDATGVAGRVEAVNLRDGILVLTSSTDHKTYEISIDPSLLPDDNSVQEEANVTVEAQYDGSRYVARKLTVNSSSQH